MDVRCYLLEITERAQLSLRRYSSGSKCPLPNGYHDNSVVIGETPVTTDRNGYFRIQEEKPPHDDPRWPTRCDCGYQFTDDDVWQLSWHVIYRRTDTGEETTLRDAAPGAMYYADWYSDVPEWCGPDGRALMVKTPDGHTWHVDGEASNCTRKGDKTHKCWIRHGTPPLVTVDKNGVTCAAGAGSILTPKWHGFLRNGVLVEC
jgi:hypothetical protein